jgi:hypothetical protein
MAYLERALTVFRDLSSGPDADRIRERLATLSAVR